VMASMMVCGGQEQWRQGANLRATLMGSGNSDKMKTDSLCMSSRIRKDRNK